MKDEKRKLFILRPLSFILLVFFILHPSSFILSEPPAKTPAEALKLFQVADDLQLEQVLAEPTVAQPLSLSFDERGRLWVVQYRQYPFPAGLKPLSQDKFLRTVYDKVPPPPPHHFPGRDRITIHEDSDGDGTFDRHKTFADGLNIATSCLKGRGGVWVLNPPYLLFYPDRNNDDVPDGDPVVHLQGFGLEDTQSVVNSLHWGPDGWLYAAQGSTVTSAVKRPGLDKVPVHAMGQNIWRYHPEKRLYEIFAEGGGNVFGLEIDAKGRLFSGHNGGDTRGFHYVQGGYYEKGFAKHGPLSNPYAFGYFKPMKHPKSQRFTHSFVIYEETALPKRYHGKLLAIDPLSNYVVASDLFPDGSSFQTKDLFFPLTTKDRWFSPVDIKVGPDGAVYLADFYEGQLSPYSHHQGKIDTSNGRIYRLRSKEAKPLAPLDMNKFSARNLVELLQNGNRWHRRMALRLLGDRQDAAARPLLRQMLEGANGQDALEALWGLNLCGGFDQQLALRTLQHQDPHVRLWTIRLLGDEKKVAAPLARKLAEMARTEPDVEVRSQLACSARRWPAMAALPIIRNLLGHDEDVDDLHLPLLLWWAWESTFTTERERALAWLEEPAFWKLRMVRTHLLHRLMRRFAAAGTRQDLLTCVSLLRMSPDDQCGKLLLRGFEEAFQGRPVGNLPPELVKALEKAGGGSTTLALRRNRPEAVAKALAVIPNEGADFDERLQYIQIFGEIRQPRCVPLLLGIVAKAPEDSLRTAALVALQSYDDPRICATVLQLYAQLPGEVRSVAQNLLAGRRTWALQLLQTVDRGRIDRAAVPADLVRRLTAYRDERIAVLIDKHWGKVEGATTAAMQKQIERLEMILGSGKGSPYPGKKLFKETCGRCHLLFGQGGQVGPDLTTYRRDDLGNMLLHIVNPSAEIRQGYETVLVTTRDGRLLTGVIADRDSRVVVLRGPDGQTVALRQEQIEEMVPQRRSLMPEGLLDGWTSQQVRDLFAYLRSTQPLYH